MNILVLENDMIEIIGCINCINEEKISLNCYRRGQLKYKILQTFLGEYRLSINPYKYI